MQDFTRGHFACKYILILRIFTLVLEAKNYYFFLAMHQLLLCLMHEE